MQLLPSFEVSAVNQSNFVLWMCFFAPFGWVHHHHGCTDKNPVWKCIPFVEDYLSWQWVWNPSSPIQRDDHHHHHHPWEWWRVTIKQFFLQDAWTVMTGLPVYEAGSSGPCSRVLASLGSIDSEPTAAAGQFSGKQQQQVFVFFIIEILERWTGNEAFFVLLHLPELCVESIASWKLSVQKWSLVVSPISLCAGRMWRVFNKMPLHNAVAWMAMLQAMHGCGKEACMQYGKMCQEDEDTACIVIFIALLWAC